MRCREREVVASARTRTRSLSVTVTILVFVCKRAETGDHRGDASRSRSFGGGDGGAVCHAGVSCGVREADGASDGDVLTLPITVSAAHRRVHHLLVGAYTRPHLSST